MPHLMSNNFGPLQQVSSASLNQFTLTSGLTSIKIGKDYIIYIYLILKEKIIWALSPIVHYINSCIFPININAPYFLIFLQFL